MFNTILATLAIITSALGFTGNRVDLWDKLPLSFGATNFPTSLDALTNPGATDSVATVSHSGQHSNANDAIEALEAKLGIGASTPVSNSMFTGTSAGVSSWSTTPTITGLTLTNLLLTGSSTLQNFTFVNATGTAATTTNSFSTTASSTNLFFTTASGGTITTGTLLASASTTLQNFTFTNATGTSATTTNLYVSGLASTTNLRTNTGTIGSLTVGSCTGCSAATAASTTGPYFASSTKTEVLNLATTTQSTAGNLVNFFVDGYWNTSAKWYYSDFIGAQTAGNTDATDAPESGWKYDENDSAANGAVGQGPDPYDSFYVNTGGTSGNDFHLTYSGAVSMISTTTPAFEIRLRPNNRTIGGNGMSRTAIGFSSQLSGTTWNPTNGVYFYIDATENASWKAVTRNNGTADAATTTIASIFDPSLNKWQTLRAEYSPDSARFFINGQVVAETFSSIPDGNGDYTGFVIFGEHNGTTAAEWDVDYVKIWALDRTRP